MDYVVCLDCGLEGSGEFGIEDAIAAWNKKVFDHKPTTNRRD
jgi:hypothetical protein